MSRGVKSALVGLAVVLAATVVVVTMRASSSSSSQSPMDGVAVRASSDEGKATAGEPSKVAPRKSTPRLPRARSSSAKSSEDSTPKVELLDESSHDITATHLGMLERWVEAHHPTDEQRAKAIVAAHDVAAQYKAAMREYAFIPPSNMREEDLQLFDLDFHREELRRRLLEFLTPEQAEGFLKETDLETLADRPYAKIGQAWASN